MSQEKRTTTDAVEILHHLYIKDDPERLVSLEAEELKSKIAQQILTFSKKKSKFWLTISRKWVKIRVDKFETSMEVGVTGKPGF